METMHIRMRVLHGRTGTIEGEMEWVAAGEAGWYAGRIGGALQSTTENVARNAVAVLRI